MPGQCRHTKPNGQRCRGRARAGRDYCAFHDPANRQAQREARRAGGRARSRVWVPAVLPADTPDVDVANKEDVCKLGAATINHVLRGQLDPKVANSVGYLMSILLKVFQADELEDVKRRLEALEEDHRRRHATKPR